MNQESLMLFFRWLSYIGLFFVFVSTVGTSVIQTHIAKKKDIKIDTLVSGNKELLTKNDELLLKINQYQQDLQIRDIRIKELEIMAKKANRGITSTYDFNGAKRETSAGRSSVSIGDEIGVFQRLLELEKNKNYLDLASLCENQINKMPEWLTPYLFLGIAYANLGYREKAIFYLEHVLKNAPGDPDYNQAKTILDQIKKNK